MPPGVHILSSEPLLYTVHTERHNDNGSACSYSFFARSLTDSGLIFVNKPDVTTDLSQWKQNIKKETYRFVSLRKESSPTSTTTLNEAFKKDTMI